jgi:predicted ATPase/GAF domain-containing protein
MVGTYREGEKLYERFGTTIRKAVREADGSAVILKTVDPRASRPRDLERLRHELQIGKALGHGAVRYLALETHQGLPTLVIEDFGGEPLARELDGGKRMSVERFLSIAARTAHAVAQMHACGVVHKDLKPENILVAPSTGEVRITDFGIATRLPREQVAATSGQLIEGSLPFISPEQTGRMNRPIDHRSDLYSLGITFYQLLTGHLPFEAKDVLGWVHCHIAVVPPSPTDIVDSIPNAVSDVVMKLIAKVPEDRYQSALGLAHDLEQCLDQWRARGFVAPFVLGERDRSERLMIPHTLYGRDAERQRLLTAFERVATTGSSLLMLVSGYSGVGKSSLISELQKPIVARRGFFVAGKFEQLKRDIPHLPISAAFRALAREILVGSEQQVAQWRQRLVEALGSNAQLVIDMVPELEMILGAQPPVVALQPSEAENRLFTVVGRFVDVFARDEHPLTIFVDDLQWADAATLRLIEQLVSHNERRHLLVVGAYRDNEVSESHPVTRMREQLAKAGVSVSELRLAPLDAEHVGLLVASMLGVSPADVTELTTLVHAKSGGNPFFAIQFLAALERNGLLAFDRASARWTWNIAKIATERFTDNVAELIAGTLALLPVDTREVLKLVACLGHVVAPAQLALVSGRSEEELETSLLPALEHDVLVRIGGEYRFPHDRVHEAATALLSDAERTAAHLSIGRVLLARVPTDELEDRLFDIVGHLDLGAPLVESEDERDRIAELNLRAGLRARRATAFASAAQYFGAGASLLGPETWTRKYELAFPLHLQWSECAVASGHHAAADKLVALLSVKARTKMDRTAVDLVKTMLNIAKGQLGVETALECLRQFGFETAPHPTLADVMKEYAAIWQALGSRRIEELLDLPLMDDPEMLAAMRIMGALFAPAYFHDKNLFTLNVLRMVRLSIERGNAPTTPPALGMFGALLGPMFDRYQEGYRVAKLGFDLVARHGFAEYKAKASYTLELAAIWTQPLDVAIRHIEDAFEWAVETGDVEMACYACHHVTFNLIMRGVPLEEVCRMAERRLAFVRRAGYHDSVDVLRHMLQLAFSLQGRTNELGGFDDAGFDEQLSEARVANPTVACWYWILKMMARFCAGRYEEALAASEKATPLLGATMIHVQITSFHFYRALTVAALCDGLSEAQRAERIAVIRSDHERLHRWAQNNPSSFHCMHALVGAELERLEGRDAMHAYEKAIQSARATGFVQVEGIANELAAKYWHGKGLERIADTYNSEARACFLHWGADGKVKQIDRHQRRPSTSTSRALTIAMGVADLDLLAIVKASQMISGEIDQDRLLRTLLQVVLEHGGARTGVLVFHDGSLVVRARAVVGEASVDVQLGSEPISASGVPTTILQYVWRTRQRVVVDDVEDAPLQFAGDEYLARMHPRSLVCLPITRQGEVLALLYLENDLAPGAFTRERLTALELLAAQAAISLENAELVRRERVGRTHAEILADATHVMSTTFDHARALDELVRLCVRGLADWATVDVEEDGSMKSLANAHRDPAKQAALAELASISAWRGARSPIVEVLKSGIARHFRDVDGDILRKYTMDAHHVEILRRVGCGSAMIVPLVARGSVLGALTLVSAQAGRYTSADLELATELARRAALMIDNVRHMQAESHALRRLARVALAVKDMANTPLQTLNFCLYLLAQQPSQDHPEILARMWRAVDRLKQLDDLLSAYTQSIDWEHGDEAFDALAVLARNRT